MLIPSPPEGDPSVAGGPLTPAMLGAAFSAVADMRGFCGRQPGVCETAGFVAGKLEAKAKHGVKIIYEWANEGTGDPVFGPVEADAAADIQTGSTSAADGPAAQTTLKLDDLIPDWRGPEAS